mmetsp:Transcript_63717/g.149358  ORF Transcript_63717/g.149358 Transcript_63717/m.149358 type:complete len:148 (+) Transcript_63717:92-535(+)
MSMVTPELSRFQALNSMPPPLKPFEDELVDETMPAPPQGIDAATKRYTGSDAAEHEEMSVVSLASLETRQSYFSENLPDKAAKTRFFAPNRILHDRHAAKLESMLKELSTVPGMLKLKKEVVLHRTTTAERKASLQQFARNRTRNGE